MKLLRRLTATTAMSVLAFSSLLTFFAPSVAHAATQTCTWNGTAGDNKFSTATNWTCDSGSAPAAGVILAFDISTITADTTLTQDLTFAVGGFKSVGTENKTYKSYIITGSVLNISGTMDVSSYIKFNLPIKAVGPLVITGASFGSDASLDLGVNSLLLTQSARNYPDVPSQVTGTGSITVAGGTRLYPAVHDFRTGVITPFDFKGWAGKIVVKEQSAMYLFPGVFTDAVSFEIQEGSVIQVCGMNGASIPNSLTIGGKGQDWGAMYLDNSCALIGFDGTGATDTTINPKASAKWTGPIVLTADTEVAGLGELTVAGSLSGNYKLTQIAGDIGKVTIASSNNTSQSSNGTQTSVALTQTSSGTKDESIRASANQIVILDGQRTGGFVSSGGTLKGNGVLTQGLIVAVGGIIAPGNSPGCITSDELALAGTYQFDLGGTDPCSGYDQLKVLNKNANDNAVSFMDDSTDTSSAILQLSLYNGFKPQGGQVFTIIDQAGSKAVQGTFKDMPEGATFTQDGVTYKISYVGGDGNDVVLTVPKAEAAAKAAAPKTPDTGVGIVSSHPLISLTLFSALSAGLVMLARRASAMKVKV